ncbi:conserved hypothetical protein [Tenacibaculum sp. 190524A05c]|uniref:hypothetical protein n=1 Tax=Tenacibaculum platacis TaxID=3137852 RepID=UPI0031FAFF5E
MKSIFKKYNLAIKNNIVTSEDSSKQILVHFLLFWNKIKDIEEDLLPELMLIINEVLDFNDIGADVVGLAYIEKLNTKLMGSDLGHPDLILPTRDFHKIILEWLTILRSTNTIKT